MNYRLFGRCADYITEVVRVECDVLLICCVVWGACSILWTFGYFFEWPFTLQDVTTSDLHQRIVGKTMGNSDFELELWWRTGLIVIVFLNMEPNHRGDDAFISGDDYRSWFEAGVDVLGSDSVNTLSDIQVDLWILGYQSYGFPHCFRCLVISSTLSKCYFV